MMDVVGDLYTAEVKHMQADMQVYKEIDLRIAEIATEIQHRNNILILMIFEIRTEQTIISW